MKNVLEYLENTAERLPDKTGVTDPDGSYSFRELEEKAKRVGSFLAGKVKPGQPVGLFMGKSKEAYAAMLGIVYAGCFSVYLNSEQGQLRLQKMAQTAKLSLVLSDQPEKAEETLGIETDFFHVSDALAADIDQATLSRIREEQTDTDPLYCNFTSGSTGTPKGVLVCHRSVLDFMNYFPDLFHIGQEDVIGNQAPFDFDVSVKDIYSSLKTGAELVLIPRKYFTVITNLLDYLDDRKVTTLTWAVSALCLVVQFRGFTYKVPSSIKHVLFSGEVMPERFLKAWMDQYPEAEFVNLYGPSEITCNCTYYRVPGQAEKNSDQESKSRQAESSSDQENKTGQTVKTETQTRKVLPIGRPFPNEKVFLLDEEGKQITEAGRTGEICVSGTCLALGYLNAPEATTKVFCQSPLETAWPERMYRTGDLGYFREDGQLCFSGRSDFQIKLFGHRIELEEVEMALNSAPGVERGFCVFNKEKNRLEGYYAGNTEPRELKGELQKLLPQYMVPSRLHQVDEIPLTEHGKMDRKRVLAEKA